MRFLVLSLLVASLPAVGGSLTYRSSEGEPMRTTISFGIAANENSKLNRTKIVVDDPSAPFKLEDTAAVGIAYDSRGLGSFKMYARPFVYPREPLVAYQYRALILDVFGQPLQTLSATHIAEVSAEYFATAEWSVLIDSTATTYHTSVIYPFAARTASGKVYQINREALASTLRTISAGIKDADLDPTKPPQK